MEDCHGMNLCLRKNTVLVTSDGSVFVLTCKTQLEILLSKYIQRQLYASTICCLVSCKDILLAFVLKSGLVSLKRTHCWFNYTRYRIVNALRHRVQDSRCTLHSAFSLDLGQWAHKIFASQFAIV